MKPGRLLGGAAFLSLAVLVYQAVAAGIFLGVRASSTDTEAAAFFLAMAFAQIGAAVAPLNLQYQLIADTDNDRARGDAGVILVTGTAVTVLGAGAAWALGFVEADGVLPLWLFMLCLTVAELTRAEHLRAGRNAEAAMVHLVLAGSLALGGGLLALTGRASDVFWLTAVLALPVFFLRQPVRPCPDPGRIWQTVHRGHRFVLFRTPTTLTDFLTARGAVLVVTGLGADFVATFFLALRIVGLPVQLVTWSLSLLFFRRAARQGSEDSTAQLARAWRLLTRAGLPLLWLGAGAAFWATPWLHPLLGGEGILAPTLAVVFCYTFMLAYVGWIGRLFDTVGAQAKAFVFETCGNGALIALFWGLAQSGDVAVFLPLWLAGHLVYNTCWTLFLFHTLRQPLGLVVGGFALPQMLAAAGVWGLFMLIGT